MFTRIKLRRINHKLPIWTVPIVVLITGLLAYGILLDKMGFYWDEWPFLWFNHAFGQAGVLKYFDTLRPFLGYLYAATLPVFGTNPFIWQIFGMITRCLAGLSLWWALRKIWPMRLWTISAVVVLFGLYPSFSQQFISIMWSHLFIILALFFLSIGLMVKSVAVVKQYWFLMIAAVVLSSISIFTTEYFFGLELLRPLILFIIFEETGKSIGQRIRTAIIHWIPYLIMMGIYLYWRIAVYKFPTYQPEFFNNFLANPWIAMINLLIKIGTDLKSVIFDSLVRLLQNPIGDGYGLVSIKIYWMLVFIVCVVISGYFYFLKPDNDGKVSFRIWPFPILFLGVVGLLFAGIPFMVTSLPVNLGFPNDRFTLPYILGASLLIIGLVELLQSKIFTKAILVGTLVGLSIGVQYQNASSYWNDWNIQNNFLWQMYWRAPAIEPGTLIISEKLPHYFESDNSLTAALNWMYAPDYSGGDLPYLLSYGSVRINTGVLSFNPDTPIHQNYKVTDFHGNTSQAVVLYNKLPGCVRILNAERDKRLPALPTTILKALPLSRPELISSDPATIFSPPVFLGQEPIHGWCYYFEKADLAGSHADWEQVANLGDQAFLLENRKNEPEELIIFIEGYAHTGEWEKAVNLTREAFQKDPLLDKSLCLSWGRIERNVNLSETGENARREIFKLIGCN